MRAHLSLGQCTGTQRSVCPWNVVNGCPYTSDPVVSISNHARKHSLDPRGPCKCSHDCGRFFADPLTLLRHQSWCSYSTDPSKSWSIKHCRLDLPIPALSKSTSTHDQQAAKHIIVFGRSSCDPPKAWKAGAKHLSTRGERWGGAVLKEWLSVSHTTQIATATLHLVWNCRTKFFPVPLNEEYWKIQGRATQHDRKVYPNSSESHAEVRARYLGCEQQRLSTCFAFRWPRRLLMQRSPSQRVSAVTQHCLHIRCPSNRPSLRTIRATLCSIQERVLDDC